MTKEVPRAAAEKSGCCFGAGNDERGTSLEDFEAGEAFRIIVPKNLYSVSYAMATPFCNVQHVRTLD